MSDAESFPLELAVEAITTGLLRAIEAQSEVSGFDFDVPILSGAFLRTGRRLQGGVAQQKTGYATGSAAVGTGGTQGRAV